jgi:hypothetical protein
MALPENRLNSFGLPRVACHMSEDDFPIGVPGLEDTSPKGMSFLEGLAHALLFVMGFVGALMVMPSFIPARSSGQLTACKSNCKNLATALEMYASDNAGLYPTRLDQLVPGNYLKTIPTCPAAGMVTYTDYKVSPRGTYFRFSCVGNNHASAYGGFDKSSNNYPAYSAAQGLVDHP